MRRFRISQPITEPRRKFTIADFLVVTAGVAAAFGLMRAVSESFRPGELWNAFVSPNSGWSVGYAYELVLELGVALGVPCLGGWTPACLVLALRKPRARWRRFRREPGFVAILLATVVVALTFVVASTFVGLFSSNSSELSELFITANVLCGCLGGSVILGSWTTMLLTRIWRPTPTWTDRLGRLTGVAWLVHGGVCLWYIALAVR